MCFPAETYGAHGDARADAMIAVLDRARAMAELGVVLRDPLPKADSGSWPDSGPFCIGEIPEKPIASPWGKRRRWGCPAVVRDIGCVAERVGRRRNRICGRGRYRFARRGCAILKDDELWRRLHAAAPAQQRQWCWDDAAAAFEKLLPV